MANPRITDEQLARYSEELRFDDFDESKPPDTCPFCNEPATEASRDEEGVWTWNCKEGCNP